MRGAGVAMAMAALATGAEASLLSDLNGSSCAVASVLQDVYSAAENNCTRCPSSVTCDADTEEMIKLSQGEHGLQFWWFFLNAILVCVAIDTLLKVVADAQFGEKKKKIATPPYTAAVFFLGVLVVNAKYSLPTGFNLDNYGLHKSIESWLEVSPETVLFVLLPPLLFEDASDVNVYVFRRVFWNCFLLASVGVVICTFMSAVAFKVILPWVYTDTNVTWVTSLLLGCILSATDPVAVIAVLKNMGAPDRLSTLIAGESLLNDGSAVVMFLVLKEFMMVCGTAPTAGDIVKKSIWLSLGGPLIGVMFFTILAWALKHMHGKTNYTAMSILIITTTYTCFFVAEHYLHVSGVLAVVTLGVLFANFKTFLERDFNHANHMVLSCMSWAATTVIFLVTGMKCAHILIEANLTEGNEAGLFNASFMRYFIGLCLIYVALFLSRAAMLAMLSPILNGMGYGVSIKEAAILTWGALRGAVALAMALLIKQEAAIPCTIQKIVLQQVVGVVGLTLIINAPLTPTMYNRLKMYHINTYRNTMDVHGLKALQIQIKSYIRRLMTHKKYWFHQQGMLSATALDQLMPNFSNSSLANGMLSDVSCVSICTINFHAEDSRREIDELNAAAHQAADGRAGDISPSGGDASPRAYDGEVELENPLSTSSGFDVDQDTSPGSSPASSARRNSPAQQLEFIKLGQEVTPRSERELASLHSSLYGNMKTEHQTAMVKRLAVVNQMLHHTIGMDEHGLFAAFDDPSADTDGDEEENDTQATHQIKMLHRAASQSVLRSFADNAVDGDQNQKQDVQEAFDFVVLMNFQSKFESLAAKGIITPHVMQELKASLFVARDRIINEKLQVPGEVFTGAISVFWERIQEALFEDEGELTDKSKSTCCFWKDDVCARIMFTVEILFATSEAVDLALDEFKIIDSEDTLADDGVKEQLQALDVQLRQYITRLRSRRPYLMRLVHTTFVSRLVFNHAKLTCGEYQKHGVLSGMPCKMAIRELSNRDFEVRERFADDGSMSVDDVGKVVFKLGVSLMRAPDQFHHRDHATKMDLLDLSSSSGVEDVAISMRLDKDSFEKEVAS